MGETDREMDIVKRGEIEILFVSDFFRECQEWSYWESGEAVFDFGSEPCWEVWRGEQRSASRACDIAERESPVCDGFESLETTIMV